MDSRVWKYPNRMFSFIFITSEFDAINAVKMFRMRECALVEFFGLNSLAVFNINPR